MTNRIVRSTRVAVLALVAGCGSTSALAIEVNIDQYTIVRNGSILFDDTFADGAPPPSAPNFVTGAPASYSVFGTIGAGAESGGVLRLDSALGAPSGNAINDPRLVVSALLQTSTNGATSLGSGNILEQSGTFSLTVPTGPDFSGYGIRFTDAAPGGTNQFAQLFVGWSVALMAPVVSYVFQDFVADTVTTLGFSLLAAPSGADQIRLTLSRPSAANNDFFGSFSYLSGGLVVGAGAFDTPGVLFQGESFVRGQFFAAQSVPLAPIPEPEIILLMSVGGVFLWVAKRRGRAHARLAAAS